MPLTHVICPSGATIPVDICLNHCSKPCATLPTRKLLTTDREWKGVASTTQLLNGTQYEFLKITQPYAVNIQERVFILLGIKTHEQLEFAAKGMNIPAEIALSGDRDIFDLLEPANDGWIISDYKVWGSYKVAKSLGIEAAGKKPDPSGERYKTSGKWGKAGDVKMVNTFTTNPAKRDMYDVEMQLNRYRVMLKNLGFKIIKMQLQIMVRDHNTVSADSRGVEQGIYLVDIDELPDRDVTDFFGMKASALEMALKAGKCASLCTEDECWGGIRCKSYCEVAKYCIKGQLK